MSSSDSDDALPIEKTLLRMLFISIMLALSCLSFCLGSVAITLLRLRSEKDIEKALPHSRVQHSSRVKEVARDACNMAFTRVIHAADETQ